MRTILLAALALLAPIAAAVPHNPDHQILSPEPGSTIPPDEPVLVRVVFTGPRDVPDDIALMTLDHAYDWRIVEDFEVNGRMMRGTYIPTEAQGSLVNFHLWSPSGATYGLGWSATVASG